MCSVVGQHTEGEDQLNGFTDEADADVADEALRPPYVVIETRGYLATLCLDIKV